jgi:hypothetical protein
MNWVIFSNIVLAFIMLWSVVTMFKIEDAAVKNIKNLQSQLNAQETVNIRVKEHIDTLYKRDTELKLELEQIKMICVTASTKASTAETIAHQARMAQLTQQKQIVEVRLPKMKMTRTPIKTGVKQ